MALDMLPLPYTLQSRQRHRPMVPSSPKHLQLPHHQLHGKSISVVTGIGKRLACLREGMIIGWGGWVRIREELDGEFGLGDLPEAKL